MTKAGPYGIKSCVLCDMLIKPLPINGVSWLQVFSAGNRLLWDAQGPSLEHVYRAVRAGCKGPVTAASKHYIILTA